ncbi:SOS response-associated peptidase [Rhodococcus sp. SGAir0479]|uniref:SOS response-associated peptidase n=1 Tax=Rhodococcus sp. SGAir0479 TaxID=2567884 RepID=UPI0010CD1CCA|nr:SOS response-associated peptidase [Rhodococcus sp. SGAir0479]QCQ91401.1 SOS response-associated peptidase [Rhodococcus sp. SGAir0479]
MCGRYASTTTDKELRSLFDVAESVGAELPPSYNVAPTQQVRVVLERTPRNEPEADAERQLRTAKWGLVPAWAKDPKIGSRLVNARSETITEKPSFRNAATKRRCIIPADGYFEWMKDEAGRKIPFFLHGDERVLAMAGLYELWPDPAKREDDPDRWLWTTTVLTTRATDTTGHIHDRSPVVLPESFWEHWLDPAIADRDEVQAMVNSVPEPHLHPYEVSTEVNKVDNNHPGLLEPVRPEQ